MTRELVDDRKQQPGDSVSTAKRDRQCGELRRKASASQPQQTPYEPHYSAQVVFQPEVGIPLEVRRCRTTPTSSAIRSTAAALRHLVIAA